MADIISVPIGMIKPNPKNPRVIKDDKFAKLVKSIKGFPQMLEKRPLVCFTDVDGKYVVLGGNMRLKASKECALKELPKAGRYCCRWIWRKRYDDGCMPSNGKEGILG